MLKTEIDGGASVARKASPHRGNVAGSLCLGLWSLLLGACETSVLAPPDVNLRAAGATLPEPLYERWFDDYGEQHRGNTIAYEAVGSGGGRQQFMDELVDFAASDDPLTAEEIARVDRGVRQVPMTSGAIVLAYNLRDAHGQPVSDLRLSRKAYAGIFLGEITQWDNEEIAQHNPGVALPDTPIQVEYRLDASGTTSALTRHLSEISERWKTGPGNGQTIAWPTGAGMRQDRGIARALKQVPGSIGYLSHTYAANNQLPVASLENKAGKFVQPSLNAIQIALREARGDGDDQRLIVSDPEGAEAYPIVTYSWILCYRVYEDPDKLAVLKDVLAYGLQQGQQVSAEMGYVPLPNQIAQSALSVLDEITLPLSADTATALPAPTAESPAQAVLPSEASAKQEEQEKEKAAGQPADMPEKAADVQADDTSVEKAAEKDAKADTEPSKESDDEGKKDDGKPPDATPAQEDVPREESRPSLEDAT